MAETSNTVIVPPTDLVDKILSVNLWGPTLSGYGHRQDIWITDGEVGPHTDSTPNGFWTYLWIIHNDQQCQLRELATNEYTPLPVGSLLCFNNALPHATAKLVHGGRFAFLAWDMPHDVYTMEMFIEDLRLRLVQD